MTYLTLDASTETTKVNVSQYRDAISFMSRMTNRAESPACRWDEVIGERQSYLLAMFRAARELQMMTCTRASADDKARHTEAIARGEQVLNNYADDYFDDPANLSINNTDDEIGWNWAASTMADALTYLRLPNDYPKESAQVLAQLRKGHQVKVTYMGGPAIA